jgi:glucose/arabinose dehydrogenase
VTGLRNGEGLAFDAWGRIYATQHGRDQLREKWPPLYTPIEGANEPAEELVQLQRGADYGWPECYFDYTQHKLVLAPENGGHGGKTVGVLRAKAQTSPLAMASRNNDTRTRPYANSEIMVSLAVINSSKAGLPL